MQIFSPKSWPLAIKLSLTVTIITAAVGFMIGTVMVMQDWKRFHQVLGEKALLLSESVAIATPKALLRRDYWSVYQSLKNLTSKRPEIITAMVLDGEGRIQAHLHPGKNPMGLMFAPENAFEQDLFAQAMRTREPIVLRSVGFTETGFLEGVVPLFADQKYLGVVRVRLSNAQVHEEVITSAFIVLGLVLVFVVIGSVLGTIASRRMVKPLTAVTRGLEAVGRGEMTDFAPIPIKDRDEIGRLSVTYNQIMVELAEKKMLEEEIAMSEKLVALGRITAGVAHEVNNPLAGMLNCIDTLREHPGEKELIDRYLPVIDQGLNRIKDIVHNLLVGLKIDEGDEVGSIDHIDKLQDLIRAEIGDKNIDILWENNANKGLQIPGKLEQIVFNLLKNAVEVLPDGGTVAFKMYLDGAYLNIEVSDDGPGIPAKIRHQLFDPFFTTKPNGTGLGLWVVYRLTQNLEGIIEVESEKDQGTSFHISVPVKTTKAA